MKKFSFILAAFAATLMTFSCNKAEKIVDAPEEDGYEYTFFIGETKATLNDATIAWESGDKDKAKSMSLILARLAELLAGAEIEDPAAFVSEVAELF